MLVLTVRDGEEIAIGDDVKIYVRKEGSAMKLSFDAPKSVSIVRTPAPRPKNLPKVSQSDDLP